MSEDRIAALEAQVAALASRVTISEDEQAVKKLQYLYGYLIDKCLYNEVVDLFAPDGEVWFFGGKFKGQAGVRRLYVERFQANFTYGNNGPIDGFLLDHPQLQMIVNIDPDGQTAHVRGRSMMQAGRHKDYTGDTPMLQSRQWFEGGIYENTYTKIDGQWRIKVLNYLPQWHADYETGWAHTRDNYVPFLSTTYPTDPTGPDELIDDVWLWPTHKWVPYHKPHPVTGKPIVAQRWQGDIDRENAKKG